MRYLSSVQPVQFSRSVMSNSLWPRESQHARPPCPLPTPWVCSNSCPSSWWCHPALSSSVVPFSSCPQSLPASGSFPVSQIFAWGGQSIRVSALASVPPVNNWCCQICRDKKRIVVTMGGGKGNRVLPWFSWSIVNGSRVLLWDGAQ